MEGLLFDENYLQPWKYIWELLNCYHLGVANVGKWRLGWWVLQVMGQFARHDDDIFWVIIVGEWSIVWEKFNTIWVPLSSYFSETYVMAPIVVHWRTKIPSFYSMWGPSSSHSWFFMNNYFCYRRGYWRGNVVKFPMELGIPIFFGFMCNFRSKFSVRVPCGRSWHRICTGSMCGYYLSCQRNDIWKSKWPVLLNFYDGCGAGPTEISHLLLS